MQTKWPASIQSVKLLSQRTLHIAGLTLVHPPTLRRLRNQRDDHPITAARRSAVDHVDPGGRGDGEPRPAAPGLPLDQRRAVHRRDHRHQYLLEVTIAARMSEPDISGTKSIPEVKEYRHFPKTGISFFLSS